MTQYYIVYVTMQKYDKISYHLIFHNNISYDVRILYHIKQYCSYHTVQYHRNYDTLYNNKHIYQASLRKI